MNTSKIDALAMAVEASSVELHRQEAQAESKRNATAVSQPTTPAQPRGNSFVESPTAAASLQASHESTVVGPAKNTAAAASMPSPQWSSLQIPNATTDGNVQPPSTPSPNRKKSASFVDKLHAMLANKNIQHITAWLPSGKSFVILEKEAFTKTVLPSYFKEAKFESFSRRIKRCGFKKAYANGQKSIVYSHEMFQKDRLDLCKTMNGRASDNQKDEAKDDTNKTVQAAELARTEMSLQNELQFNQLRPQLLQHQLQPNHPQPMQEGPSSAPNMPPQPPIWMPGQAPVPALLSYEQAAAMGNPYAVAHVRRHSASVQYPSTPQYANGNAYNVLQPRPHSMPPIDHNREIPARAAMLMSALDEEIADLQEQLVILHRLRALRDRRRNLNPE